MDNDSKKMGDSKGGFSEQEMKAGYRQVGTQPMKGRDNCGYEGNDGDYDPKSPKDDHQSDPTVKVKGE